jgi:hypothetical protein
VAAPNQKVAAPNQKVAAPNQKVAAPNQKVAAPNQKVALGNLKVAAPNQKVAAPNQKVAAGILPAESTHHSSPLPMETGFDGQDARRHMGVAAIPDAQKAQAHRPRIPFRGDLKRPTAGAIRRSTGAIRSSATPHRSEANRHTWRSPGAVGKESGNARRIFVADFAHVFSDKKRVSGHSACI